MTRASDRTSGRSPDALDPVMAFVGLGWSVLVVLLVSGWQPEQQTFVWTVPWPSLLAQAALGLTLLLRRRLPLTVAAGSLLGSAALLLLTLLSDDPALAYSADTQLIAPAVTPFVSYAVVRYSERRGAAWALVLLTTVLLARPWVPALAVITTAAVYVALPALLGAYVAARRRLIRTLTERAERAEAEQRLLAEAARADERVRLAEEVHGAVTERTDQMLRLAGQLAERARSEATRTAAAELTSAGRHANDELRTLLRLLRSGSAVTTPEPAGRDGGTDLSALVSESVAAGVPVTLDEHGDPGALSPAVGRTAYRIVQEALTNVHKHAPGSRVTVSASYRHREVRIQVRNTAPELAVTGRPTGSGTGLLGLRQRVALVDGTLRAEPTEDGGFLVDAILPAYVPAPAADQPNTSQPNISQPDADKPDTENPERRA